MSKINTINNNERKYNNFNERKKTNKQPKVNPNELKAPLFLSADLNENIVNEILDVLAETKFNKISMPLGTYRCLIDSDLDESDTRVCTIGYIRSFNPETKEFTVIVFSKFLDLIKEYGDIAMELQFTNHKEHLGTITKFNIVPVVYEEESEDVNEVDE